MARKVTIGGEGTLVKGQDAVIDIEVLDDDGAPVNIAGFALQFLVKAKVDDVDADALINGTTPTAVSIVGIYNADPDINSQRARVTLTDTLMTIPAGNHQQSLWRTDDGSERPIVYGPFVVELTTRI